MAAAGAKLALFVDYWYRRQLVVAMTAWLQLREKHMELVPLLKKKKTLFVRLLEHIQEIIMPLNFYV
jgi:hypothetical protein